jgi:hypothetical protein
MAQDPVLQSLLLTAARAMGAKVDMAPTEWTGEVFNAEVLSTAFIKEPLQRHNRDLPRLVGAARLDDMPVLIGELEGPPNGHPSMISPAATATKRQSRDPDWARRPPISSSF